MPTSREFSAFFVNEIVKCLGYVYPITRICNQFGSLGKSTESSCFVELDSNRWCVDFVYQVDKSDDVVTTPLSDF